MPERDGFKGVGTGDAQGGLVSREGPGLWGLLAIYPVWTASGKKVND